MEFSPFSPGFLCNLVKSRPKMWKNCPIFGRKKVENPVTSLAVMVCSVPKRATSTEEPVWGRTNKESGYAVFQEDGSVFVML